MKRGQIGFEPPTQMIIGLILGGLFLLGLGLTLYNLAKENPDVRTSITYDKFLEYYQTCTKQTEESCLCEDFEFTVMPRGESIELEQLPNNKIAVHLKKAELREPTKTTLLENKQLCTYDYKQQTKRFEKTVKSTFNIEILTNPNTIIGERAEHFLRLYKEGNDFCFVNYLSVPRGVKEGRFVHNVIDPKNVWIKPVEKELEKLLTAKKLTQCSEKKEKKEEKKPEEDPSLFEIS